MSEERTEPEYPLGGDEVSDEVEQHGREVIEREKDVLDRLK